MSDIIQDAKQLLEGATPGPWEWFGYSLYSKHETVLDFQCVTEFGMSGASRAVEVTPEDEALIAAAPELAEVIAGMEYEYRYERPYTLLVGEWCPMGRGNWFTSVEEAKADRDRHDIGMPTRLVRRRVSPPEVINE